MPPPVPPAIPSPPPDRDRYSRQILFPGIGAAGQAALARAHVAIVGVGATGAASASLLARAGIGHLTLIDRDFVEPSNLQRQILFDEADAEAALPKAEAARRKLLASNSTIRITAHIADLVPGNIHDLISDADLVLDATDNFETRYLINDFAVEQGLPWIYAAVVAAYAATMTILPRRPSATNATQRIAAEPAPPADPSAYTPTACLACIFPKPPTGPVETCDTAGILSTAVNLAASLQVTEALKLLTGQPHLLRRTLVSFELWQPVLSHSAPSAAPRLDHAEISAATPAPAVRSATIAASPISPAPSARTSRSAAATPFRSTSTTAPSTSPPCRRASPSIRMSPISAPTRCCSASAAAPTP